MNNRHYRVVNAGDVAFMKEMLYEAVYWRSLKQGKAPSMEEGLKADGVMTSVLQWGTRDQDLGIIALEGSERIGAVWIRCYTENNSIRGFINERIPVLVIGIRREFRNQGLGTRILEELFQEAKDRGISGISLMVSEDNEALNLYEKTGFSLQERVDDSLLMLKEL